MDQFDLVDRRRKPNTFLARATWFYTGTCVFSFLLGSGSECRGGVTLDETEVLKGDPRNGGKGIM